MSLPIDEILDVLRAHKIDGQPLQSIAKDLIAAEKEVKEDRAAHAVPKPKKKSVVLIRGDAALKAQVAGGAYIVQVEEADDTTTLLGRISAAARSYNEGLRRNRANRVVRTFVKAMEYVG